MFFASVLGAIGLLAGLVILSALGGVLSLAFWLVLLPFRLLGLVFRGVAFVLFLPFMLLLGGGLLFLVGLPILFVLMILAAPAILFALAIVWLARRGVRRAAV